MSNEAGKPSTSQAEFEEAGGQLLAETVRDQMREGVSALRGKLAAAKSASEKAAAADKAAMDDYLRPRVPPTKAGR